jgi:hypothetical protein
MIFEGLIGTTGGKASGGVNCAYAGMASQAAAATNKR